MSITPSIVMVGEAVAGQSTALRKKLLALSQELRERTFDLAEALHAARHVYRGWGYDNLGEYSETELGIKERRARYLIRIVEVCNVVGIERAVYEPVGVSKLREITTLNPQGQFFNTETKKNEPLKDHIIRLIDSADDMTGTEIEEEVKRLKGMTGENAMVIRSYSVTQACWDGVIKPAMELARMKLGSQGRDQEGKATEYSDGAVMECLAAEFLADPNNNPTIPVTNEEFGAQDIPIEFEGSVQLNAELLQKLAQEE